MLILCLISTKILDKKIDILDWKELITNCIDQLKKTLYYENNQMKIVIITNSEKYTTIDKEYGAEIPILIPQNLISDYECMKYMIDYLKNKKKYNPDIILHLRQIQGVVKIEDINKCLDSFIKNFQYYDRLKTVVPNNNFPNKIYKIKDNLLVPLIKTSKIDSDILIEPENQETYIHNGYIDILKPYLLNYIKIRRENIYPYIMNKEDIIDIDTLEDWNYNPKIIIIHYKFTRLANSPNEIYQLQKKNETELINYYFVNDNKNKLYDLINKNSNNKIIIHFHNEKLLIINSNIKQIIHYHSEPTIVNLKINNTFEKLVLNQYHCLLPQYKECKIVRNFFNNINPIIFNKKIKIGFYPSTITRKNKYFDKGYIETKPILDNIKNFFGENIIVEILYNIPYDVCIKKKSDCHIIIDECKTGSFHKTTIEGLMLGCIVFVHISANLKNIHKELYNQSLPVINTKLDTLEEKLKKIISLGKDKIERIALKNREYFLSYWNNEIIYNEYLNIYKELLS